MHRFGKGEGCRVSVGIWDVWTAASGVTVKGGGSVVRAGMAVFVDNHILNLEELHGCYT